jgi:hypothetical protein
MIALYMKIVNGSVQSTLCYYILMGIVDLFLKLFVTIKNEKEKEAHAKDGMYYGVDYNLHKDNQAISETIVLP